MRLRFKERDPYASFSLSLTGDGNDAESIQIYFSVWNEGNVTYSLHKARIRSGGGLSVPHVVIEETIAERERLPSALNNHDWSRGGRLTLKREGRRMQFFVNDKFIQEFSVSQFPVMKTSVGSAFKSIVEITSIQARSRL